MTQTHRLNRRTALAAAGVAALAAVPVRAAQGAISSGAGVVAGGSINAVGGNIQFSAFGSRFEIEGNEELVAQGALAWYDPTGSNGAPLTLKLVSVESYGPVGVDLPNARRLTGTVSANGEGEYPFALQLEDFGDVALQIDKVHLAVGSAIGAVTGTPVPAADDEEFSYEFAGNLVSGDVQLITF